MRLTWITDPHLNFVREDRCEAFYRLIGESMPDALLISGDIAEAPTVCIYLNNIESCVSCPIYFVLGNHDFYRGSIAGVRARIESFCSVQPRLIWLNNAGIVPLTGETCLIGHDGWGDARFGDYVHSNVYLSDFACIGELIGQDRDGLRKRLQDLGDESAEHFRRMLPEALERFQHILVLTHVPPFREATWHEGRISDDSWLPFFSCKAVGDVLREAMKSRPDRQMTVLCGHTHGAGEAQILLNLCVSTGGAVYGRPEITRLLTV